MVLGGDFNINLNKNSSEKLRMEKFAEELCYSQLVRENTWTRIVRINDTQKFRESRIDLVYTNDSTKVDVQIVDYRTSDHKLIVVNIKAEDLAKDKKRPKDEPETRESTMVSCIRHGKEAE